MSQVDAENVDVRSLDEALGENASEKASVPKTSAAEPVSYTHLTLPTKA